MSYRSLYHLRNSEFVRVVCLETETAASRTPVTVQCVDDFVPDEGLDKSFLEDSVASSAKHGMNIHPQPTAMDSDRYGTRARSLWDLGSIESVKEC